MGWSGGEFKRVHTWTDDESAGLNIEASRMDAEDNNFETGINACLHKAGQNSATGNLPMGGYIHTGVGNGTARTNYPSIGQIQDAGVIYATSGGTGNAHTLTLSPAITAYSTGQTFVFKAGATNTGAATINVNSVGAKSIYHGGAALEGGEIVSGQMYVIIYNGTQFDLVGDSIHRVPMCCGVTISSPQSIPNDTNTAVSWDIEDHDYGGMWSAGLPTLLVAPAAGVYTIQATVVFAINTTGLRWVVFRKNGGATYRGGQTFAGTTNAFQYCSMALPAVSMSLNEYWEVIAYQNSGGALDIEAGRTTAAMIRIR